MRPIISLVTLLLSACTLTGPKLETRAETEAERQRLRSGVAQILGIPEKSVSDLAYLQDYFYERIEPKTPQGEARQKIRNIFSATPANLEVHFEYTDRRDSVSVSYRGKHHVIREVYDFFYDEAGQLTKVFATMVTESM